MLGKNTKQGLLALTSWNSIVLYTQRKTRVVTSLCIRPWRMSKWGNLSLLCDKHISYNEIQWKNVSKVSRKSMIPGYKTYERSVQKRKFNGCWIYLTYVTKLDYKLTQNNWQRVNCSRLSGLRSSVISRTIVVVYGLQFPSAGGAGCRRRRRSTLVI